MYLEPLILVLFFVGNDISASALDGLCFIDEDCGTIDSVCNNQTKMCICKENLTVFEDTCLFLAVPKVPCKKKHDCRHSLGPRSMCTKSNFCACNQFHHLHKGQCVKNRDLDDTCEHDHQCYCGMGCEDKIACIDQICTCKPGQKPHRIRRCIDDPDAYVNVVPVKKISGASQPKPTSVILTVLFIGSLIFIS